MKRSGVKGIIETGTGSPLEVHPWEDVDFTDQGIFVYHHDGYETVTFLPLYTVRMVRLHEAEKEKMGRNVEGRVLARQRNRQPPVKFSEILELHQALDAAADEQHDDHDDDEDEQQHEGRVHER